MHNDCIEVDELIFELSDYKNGLTDVAPEKLLREALNQLGRVSISAGPCTRPTDSRFGEATAATSIKKIQDWMHQSREYGWPYGYA